MASYLTVEGYREHANDSMLPTAEGVTPAFPSGYQIATDGTAGDPVIVIDGASTAGVPAGARFLISGDSTVYTVTADVAAAADDADDLIVRISPHLAADAATGATLTDGPTAVDDLIDDERIQDAVDDASGLIRSYIPAYTVDQNGMEIPIGSISETVRDALPGYCYIIARWYLADATTGDNDWNLERYDRVIEILEILGGHKFRPTGGGGTTPGGITAVHKPARAVEGAAAGQWVPGLYQTGENIHRRSG